MANQLRTRLTVRTRVRQVDARRPPPITWWLPGCSANSLSCKSVRLDQHAGQLVDPSYSFCFFRVSLGCGPFIQRLSETNTVSLGSDLWPPTCTDAPPSFCAVAFYSSASWKWCSQSAASSASFLAVSRPLRTTTPLAEQDKCLALWVGVPSSRGPFPVVWYWVRGWVGCWVEEGDGRRRGRGRGRGRWRYLETQPNGQSHHHNGGGEDGHGPLPWGLQSWGCASKHWPSVKSPRGQRGTAARPTSKPEIPTRGRDREGWNSKRKLAVSTCFSQWCTGVKVSGCTAHTGRGRHKPHQHAFTHVRVSTAHRYEHIYIYIYTYGKRKCNRKSECECQRHCHCECQCKRERKRTS